MQGAKIKDEGIVLKYMTKSEIDEQRSSLHIMTHPHFGCIKGKRRLRKLELIGITFDIFADFVSYRK